MYFSGTGKNGMRWCYTGYSVLVGYFGSSSRVVRYDSTHQRWSLGMIALERWLLGMIALIRGGPLV